MIKKYIVIGAGISGLNTARKIKDLNLGSVQVLEKSRGVGGRMATRRAHDTRFDHGAQFYRLKNDIVDLHQDWKQLGICHQWFISEKGDHWCSKSGMTAFAKAMTKDLDISLEKEIAAIHYENNLWKLISNKNEVWFCHNLIISSPTPQTVKLLTDAANEKRLDMNVLSEIKKINYTKALIGLVTLEEDLMIAANGYIEFQTGCFFSISDQRKKGVSDIPALTITMSASFSELEFEQSDEFILEKILKLFVTDYPQAKIKKAELKKWRYCKSESQFKNLFSEIAPKLYLIGDAFGGSSLLGALRSSQALCNFLIENNKVL
ncbi:MAG: NAD(P)-binding protein [Bacteriovorax sp.]|nr:NAD(P)-binding protein [Bacteriovorax sp.]